VNKKRIISIATVILTGVLLAGCTKSTTPTTEQGDNGQAQDQQQEGQPNDKGQVKEIDYAAAAKTLGVTEDKLKAALTAEDGKMPDFVTAAKTLGVTEAKLREALGIPDMAEGKDGTPSGQQKGGTPPNGGGTAPTKK